MANNALKLFSSPLQPPLEVAQRDAVIAVVLLEVSQDPIVSGLEVPLVLDQGGALLRYPVVSLPHVERLESLDGVRLLRDAQRLPHDLVEVDEHLSAKEVVQLLFPGAMPSHQTPESADLIGSVVVHMHIGEAGKALCHQIDEALEQS